MSLPVSETAFEGFRLARERPLTVLAWSVILALTHLVQLILIAPQMEAFLPKYIALISSGHWDVDAVQALSRAAPETDPLVYLAVLIITIVINAAILRSILAPAEARFASLRLGLAEARYMLIYLATLVIISVAGIGAMLFAALVFVLAAGIGAVLASIIGPLCFVAVLAVFAFIGVRLSLALPATFAERRLVLFRAASLTNGAFWNILGVYILAAVFAAVVYLLVFIISVSLGAVFGLSDFFSGALAPNASPSAASLAGQVAKHAPIVTGFVFLMGLGEGLAQVILMAPAARVYQMLASRR